MALFQAGSNKSPLEKVVFEINVCHTGNSNGGKKWQMAIFLSGFKEKNNTSIWDTAKKKSEKQNLSD